MAEESRAPKDPPTDAGHRFTLGHLGKTALRWTPWLALATMAALRRGRRAPAPPPAAGPLTPAGLDAAEPHRGRQATAPWRIPPRGWKDIAWRSWNEFGRTRLPALSGAVTFYLLLATFPAIAAFVSLVGLFSDVDTVEREFLHFAAIFPSDAIDLIGGQMVRIAAQKHEILSTAFLVSALLSVWSANAGMQAIFDGVNVTYGEVEKRGWLPRVLLTYSATLGGIVVVVALTGVALAAPGVLRVFGIHNLAPWWNPLRWVAIPGASFLGFMLLYRFGPSRAPARWRWLVPGAAFAAVAWMAGSYAYSWYLDTFTHFGVTYGSLGAMIGFMLWIWLSVMIVLMGAELNSEIEHQTACDSTTGRPRPIGQRGAAMADSVGPAFHASPRQMRDSSLAYLSTEARNLAANLRRLIDRPRAPPPPGFAPKGPPPESPDVRPDPRRSKGR